MLHVSRIVFFLFFLFLISQSNCHSNDIFIGEDMDEEKNLIFNEFILTSSEILLEAQKDEIISSSQLESIIEILRVEEIKIIDSISKEDFDHIFNDIENVEEEIIDREQLKKEILEEYEKEKELHKEILLKKEIREKKKELKPTVQGWFWNMFNVLNIVYFVCSVILLVCAFSLFGMFFFLGGGIGGGIVAAIYSVAFILLGGILKSLDGTEVIGGVSYTIGIIFVPVSLFSFELALGLWDDPQMKKQLNILFSSNDIDEILNFSKFIPPMIHIMINTLILSTFTVSAIVLKISGDPFVQGPLYVSLYGIILGASLLIEPNLPKSLKPFWLYTSFGYSIGMFVITNTYPDLFNKYLLGAMISSLNVFFWSFPFLIAKAILSDVKGFLNSISNIANKKGKKGFLNTLSIIATAKPPLHVEIATFIYASVNVSLLFYGYFFSSWVVIPYAVLGIGVCLLIIENSILYLTIFHVPMCLLLSLLSVCYNGIVDKAWMNVLVGFGDYDVMVTMGIGIVQETLSLGSCAAILYTAHTFRLYLYSNYNMKFNSIFSLTTTTKLYSRIDIYRIFCSLFFYLIGIYLSEISLYTDFFSNMICITTSCIFFLSIFETLNLRIYTESANHNYTKQYFYNIIIDIIFIGLYGFEIIIGAGKNNLFCYFFGVLIVSLVVINLYFPVLNKINKSKSSLQEPTLFFYIGFTFSFILVITGMVLELRLLTFFSIILFLFGVFRFLPTGNATLFAIYLSVFILFSIVIGISFQKNSHYIRNIFLHEDTPPINTFVKTIENTLISNAIQYICGIEKEN